VSTVELGQTVTRLDLAVSNVQDGAAEQLIVDGSAIQLVNGASGTTAGNGLSYSVTVSGGTASIVLTRGTGISSAAAQGLVDGLAYLDASQDPTAGARVVTLTRIDDSGSNTAPNVNTAALNVNSTVTVVPVNDAPTLAATALNPTFLEGAGSSQGAAVAVFSAASIGTVEAGQAIGGLDFTVAGLLDGANECVVVDGTTISLGASSAGTTSGGIGYSVTLSGATATVSLAPATPLAPAAAEALVNAIAYVDTNIDNPTAGLRVFTLTRVQDNGGTAAGGVDSRALAVASSVTVAAQDDAPVASGPIAPQVASPLSAFTFTVPGGAFSDPDSPLLTLSATQSDGSALPAWLSFDPATRTFSGTPPAGFASLGIRLTASDGTLAASSGFVITSTGSAVLPPSPSPAASTVLATPVAPAAAPQPVATEVSSASTTADASRPALGGGLALKLPVDGSVPASDFSSKAAPGTAAPAFSAPTMPDLNALPPTGAGPAEADGFPLERVSLAQAVLQPGSSGTSLGGHRLFVFHGVPDMQLGTDGSSSLYIPEDAFAHTDPSAIVHLEARMADGTALPAWLRFEGNRGTFAGVPPEGLIGQLEIEVIARDTEGREAHTRFVLLVEDLRADRMHNATSSDVQLGLDVDKKEAEKARVEAKQNQGKASPA
ncbi:MAG: putative Ig domain-containing protein, partial [Clostridia bacterium]